MATFGDTELAPTKAEIIAEKVQRQLISESVLLGTITDVSMYARKGASSVSFPKGGDFVVQDRPSGTQATQQVFNFTKDTLLLDKRKSISWVVDPNDEIESSIDVNADLIERATRGHAVDIDVNIIAELEAVGVANTAATGDISKTIILDMRANLIKRKAMKDALYLAVSPDQEKIMLDIPDFVRADAYGESLIATGVLGLIYGVKVVVTPELAAQQYFMYEKGGLAHAFQRGPMLDSRKAPEYGAGALLYNLEVKYGVKGLQLGQQAVAATESALVEKDSNP